ADVGECRGRAAELQALLEEVAGQLGDARVDKHEEARRKKKQEIYDRMINMCQPTHKRYNVAITKVLGKYMEAIVVLKERMLEPETFLPLDYIQAKPLRERLRDIREPKNVKLLFDVLRFDPAAIHRAVLFVTNNALVCETPEDASRVAYDLDRTKNARYDTPEDASRVAYDLDRTKNARYDKSGIISGGSLDLARKAKRWDEKHLSQLKAKKEKLTEELRESMKKSRKESELTTVKQIKALDAELAELERKIDMFGPQIEEIERTIRARDLRIQEVKENMNNVEDVVFRGFCNDIGRAKKRMEFEAQIDRITSNLEFERSRDTQKNVTRWERQVQDAEDELEKGRQAEARQRSDIDAELKKADTLKADRAATRAKLDHADDDVNKARKDVTAVQKEIQSVQKHISSYESRIESKRSERHNILRQCKKHIASYESRIENKRSERHNILRQCKELDEQDEIKRKADKLQKAINSLQNTVDKIQAPNMRAMQKLNEVREKVNATNEAFVVKKERHDKFIDCFEHVANEIDAIYKNPEEPYLDGVNYNCVAPGKRFQPMSNLSGGEKTVAALALLFAIHRYFTLGHLSLQLQLRGARQALPAHVQPVGGREDGRRARAPVRYTQVLQSGSCVLGTKPTTTTAWRPASASSPCPTCRGARRRSPRSRSCSLYTAYNYNCVAPGKRFQPMSNLSGGKKTVAALALLFAIH
ncbi:Structural maintenance of chromosomes protein, partial [Operophtera brumata]